MRIGIFEMDHFEVAHTLLRLFDQPQHRVSVFTYAASYKQLQAMPALDLSGFQWIVKEDNQSKRSFIYTIYKKVKAEKIELLWLETLSDNFILYAWLAKMLPDVRILLTIHDINNYFEYPSNGTLRRYIRNTGKKILLKHIDEFTVLNSTMEAPLRAKLPEGKTVRTIPGAFFDEGRYVNPPSTQPYINITVPGTIDERRRDYNAVFALLEYCHAKQIAVRITLLGGFSEQYGAGILQQVKEYASVHNNLFWYDTETVDQPEFDRVMEQTHFIFSPTRIITVMADDVTEQYGLTKSSGNIGDMIRFARPAIVPEGLLLEPMFSKSVFRYADIKEIPDLLIRIRDNSVEYDVLKQAALEVSRLLTLKNIRAQHADVFH
ncbi:hypothetical protein HHL16_11310 [Pseudoflavitalea sp. G-6-1-2]|uniref:glycosyltransferase n=1 Tax=Pseudoflavitalea sp. G-6-1-2 TaxID=2728841 RepID=UPI00146DDF37|nr:glycosyltransferase [Pseudoflavitalea sp. G-6-1-2]NML21467.1 hypothetical protein [Pseudoflavitalea sp. G-6-1-2]